MSALMSLERCVRRCSILLFAVGLGGVPAALVAQAPAHAMPDDARVVMMPPDIRYYLITAGGNPELHAEWTADAESAFSTAVSDLADLHGLDITVLGRADLSEQALAFEGLHAALGKALITHVVNEARLPSKGNNAVSDWTLGPAVRVIAEATDADYALFVHYRENQASGSRLAFAILAATARVSIPTSSEHGFATLIDLDTGNVAWFDVLHDDGFEVREMEGSQHMASRLLGALPGNSDRFAEAPGAQ